MKLVVLLLFINSLSPIPVTCFEAILQLKNYTCKNPNDSSQESSSAYFEITSISDPPIDYTLKISIFTLPEERTRLVNTAKLFKTLKNSAIQSQIEFKKTDTLVIQVFEKFGTILSTQFLKNQSPLLLQNKNKLKLIGSLISRLYYLKEMGFILTNLTSSSFNLDDNFHVKIHDLDSAVQTGTNNTSMGNFLYADPSFIVSKALSTKASELIEVYSLGVIIYQLIHSGAFPFWAQNENDLIPKLKNGNFVIRSSTNYEVVFLIIKCLQIEHSNRLTLKTLHEYLELARKSQRLKILQENFKASNRELSGDSEFKLITQNYQENYGLKLIEGLISAQGGLLFQQSFTTMKESTLQVLTIALVAYVLILAAVLIICWKQKFGLFAEDIDSGNTQPEEFVNTRRSFDSIKVKRISKRHLLKVQDFLGNNIND